MLFADAENILNNLNWRALIYNTTKILCPFILTVLIYNFSIQVISLRWTENTAIRITILLDLLVMAKQSFWVWLFLICWKIVCENSKYSSTDIWSICYRKAQRFEIWWDQLTHFCPVLYFFTSPGNIKKP